MLITLFAAALTTAPQSPQAPDLDWLAGHWRTCEGDEMAESWTAPAAGLLLGTAYARRAGKVVSFEQMRIATTDGTTTFTAIANAGTPVAFELVEQSAARAVFRNATHDYPNIVTYARDGADLTAEVRGLPGEADPIIAFRFASAPFGEACP